MPSSNDNIQIALIGAGGMGQGDAHASTSLPGVKLIAACDLYDSRLEHMKEVYGKDIFTTRDYREVLNRKDIDAVIIATPDHWHSRISVDALNAGKHVYCEKPMVHDIEEGQGVIDAQNKSGKVFQVGSQYASSVAYLKARELFKAGAIGKLNMVDAWLDRNTAGGAWQYSIPPDASPQTVDWDRFLGNAPRRSFDPVRFFRWRNYTDYGTGVAGDLFVHLLTGLHVVTGSKGPTRIYATGGLRYWKDGRDVPDVMLATMDYPETEEHPAFNMVLRVNFKASKESFGVKLVGSEGTMMTSYNSLDISRHPRTEEFDYTTSTFPKKMQEQLRAEFEAKHPPLTPGTISHDEQRVYSGGSDFHIQHHRAFLKSIRENKPSIEDAVFGLRAAGPALLTNESYFSRKICSWNPVTMKKV